MDSLVSENSPLITDDYKMPDLRWSVYKDLYCSNTLFASSFNQVEFIYYEKQPNYELKKDKINKQGNYNLKKATAEFGNRKWEIFYTPDIPIFDGPYVFSGLPGLVYKAFSQNLDYSFELVGIKKIIETKEIKIPNSNVKKEHYAKKLQEFIKDPGHQDITFKNVWGDQFQYKYQGKNQEMIKQQEKLIFKIIDSYNNPIDKDVFLLNF